MTRANDSNDDCCCKDDKRNEVEDEDEDEMPDRPLALPDGGWGWMVVFASMMCNIIIDGICYTIAGFRHKLMEHFDCTNAQIAFIPSLIAGCYLMVGPLVSALANKYGCRRVTIFGSILSSVSFLLGSQANSIEMFIVFVGVFGGIGFGMIYLPAIVTVGFWFEKKRAFATGISVCGSGIGMILLTPLVTYLLDEYGWQGTMVILAGVILNCAVCGALFRPLDKKRTRRLAEIQRGSIMKALIEEKKRQRTISNGSLDNCVITIDNRLIKIDPAFFESKRNDSFIARFKESLGFSTKSLDKSKQNLVLPGFKIDQVSNGGISNGCISNGSVSPIYKPRAKPASQSSLSCGSSDSGCGVVPDFVLTTKSCDVIPGTNPWKKFSIESDSNLCSRSCQSVNYPILSAAASLGASVISIQVVETTPPPSTRTRHRAYRSSGSCSRLRHAAYSSVANIHPSSIQSLMSIPQYSVRTLEEYEEHRSPVKKVLYFLKEMFDFYLIRSPMFALLLVSSILSMLVFFVPFVFLAVLAESRNIGRNDAQFLISIIGITNTIGRIISGWIADRPWMDPLHFNNVSLILAGIATAFCPFFTTYSHLALYGAFFGFCVAVFVSLRSILLVDLLGLDLLTKSFGILNLFQGIASIVGTPFEGYLLDFTGSVDICFYIAGSILALSGILGIPLRFMKKMELAKASASLPEEMPINERVHLEVESTI